MIKIKYYSWILVFFLSFAAYAQSSEFAQEEEFVSNFADQAIEIFNGTGSIVFAFSNHDVPRVATRQLESLGLKPEDGDAMQLLLLKLQACLIGSNCIYQGEELGFEDVSDIPVEKLQDPWGIEFAPTFLGRDTCRTPMVWSSTESNGGFSKANKTWLPISNDHLKRAGLDQARRSGSIYSQLADFLRWRKNQPAIISANNMTKPTGGPKQIVFERKTDKQTLRCIFDFEQLIAEFEEI